MNCIAYSLFGYSEQHESSLSFKSYLRGLNMNLRIAELIYPGWKVGVVTDLETYSSPFQDWFQYHEKSGRLAVTVVPKGELCLMMLRRLQPIFQGYDRVLCRDADSLLSYREAQAVAYWLKGTRMAHAMTDSISHNIPLMGGMIGFISGEFRNRMNAQTFEELIGQSQNIDWRIKGADQTFLNQYVMPRVSDSITEHFVLGQAQSFRGDCHNYIQDIPLPMPEVYKETSGYAFHIGAAGYQVDHTVKFLQQYGLGNEYYEKIEKQYPDTFYWHL